MPSHLDLLASNAFTTADARRAAGLTIDEGGGHWTYLSLSMPFDAACPLSPLPEHASDGTCTGGAIPPGGGCAPLCEYGVRGDAMATCENNKGHLGEHEPLGLWKGMCGAFDCVSSP